MSAPAVAEVWTERLILRPIAVGDVAPFARMLADPEVVRFISDGRTATEEETAEWVELSMRRNAFEGFDRRAVVIANDPSKRVADKLGFAYERDAEFLGRTVELYALEA